MVVGGGGGGVRLTVICVRMRPPRLPSGKASSTRVGDKGIVPLLFPVESYQRLNNTGTLVATLQGAWHHRVSTRTGWPGVSML